MKKKGVFIGLQLIISIIIVVLVLFATKFLFGYESSKGWVELYNAENSITCSYLLNSFLNGEYIRSGSSFSTQLGYELDLSLVKGTYDPLSIYPSYYFDDFGDVKLIIATNKEMRNVYDKFTSEGYTLFCSSALFGPGGRGYALMWVKST